MRFISADPQAEQLALDTKYWPFMIRPLMRQAFHLRMAGNEDHGVYMSRPWRLYTILPFPTLGSSRQDRQGLVRMSRVPVARGKTEPCSSDPYVSQTALTTIDR